MKLPRNDIRGNPNNQNSLISSKEEKLLKIEFFSNIIHDDDIYATLMIPMSDHKTIDGCICH